MRLTCAIIDDEPLAVSLLESYVLKTPFLPYLERRYPCHLYDGFRSICRG